MIDMRRTVAVLAGLALCAGSALAASTHEKQGPAKLTPQVFKPVRAGVSAPLREVAARQPQLTPDPGKLRDIPNPEKEWLQGTQLIERQSSPDGALMTQDAPNAMPAPVANFQGVSQATQGAVSGFFVSPPDTVGDVGPNHYVQCVNLACQVYSKTGTAASAVFTITSLFSSASFPGDCSTTNDGDPIVLYDPLADRWQLSQFAISNRPPSHECVAVSKTNDPTGQWYLYDFVVPDNYFNDYPKLGVWPDAYYMTAPLFEGPVFGQGMFAMNRSKMLAGDPTAELVFFDLTLAVPGLQRILPADVDGPAPPAGTPNYVLTMAADEFGDPADAYRLFEVHIDWNDVDNSTMTELPSLPSAAFDPTFTEVSGNCGFAFTSRDDIEQPAPANCGMRVDSLSGRPMHRLAYRNFGTHESLTATQTVDVNATPPTATSGHLAGVRYFELRRTLPSGSWTVQEEATFSPDAVHRFMPAAAMDAQGNLAVGYSVSDATSVFPGVRYAGRLASDPPGGLFQGEALMAAGGRSQTSTGSRWGDYSAMSVDPADDCTFWYTQEYYDPTAPPSCSATACWTTRIGSFKFPGCTSSTVTGTLSGTVTDAATVSPLAGVLVSANGYTGVSNGSGAYSITLPAGTYSATASAAGYASVSASGLVVPGGGGAVQNFALPSGSLAGVVTDSVSTNPITGAKVKANTGQAQFTNGSGNYALALPAATYSITVTAPGYYNKTVSGLAVGTSGTTTANVALDPAPGLAVTATAIDDSGQGNANGAVDFAECFALKVTLTNGSTTAATGVSAVLSSSTPGVSITHATSPYPDLAASGGSGANTQVFLVTSPSSQAAAGQPIDFSLAVTSSSGNLDVPFTLATGGGPTPLAASATGPVAIPDNNGTGASLAIPVAGFSQVLSKVKVRFRITHTYDGDLVLRLKSPDGTIALLSYQLGGAGAGFGTDCPADANDTTLDDGATTALLDGTAPFVGSFRPQGSLSVFGGKTGAQVNGNWEFIAIDLGPADTGSIECVTLELNGTPFSGGGCYTKGDLNHPNLQTDLLFRNVNSNNNVVWLMDGVTRTTGAAITPNPASADWRIMGADDFNDDNYTDLVFNSTTTNAVEFWLMNGTSRPAAAVPISGAPTLALNWTLAATGDANHDGQPDILWRNNTSQKLVIWTMNGTAKVGNIIPTPDQAVDANWQVIGLSDLNLDGNTDFLWYNYTSGKIVYWWMDASMVRITGNFTNPANAGDNNWRVQSIGDYGTTCTNQTRDGQPDVIWRNDNSGRIVAWTLDAAGNRTTGCFTCPTAVGGTCNPADPPPAGATDWVLVGPR